MLPLQQGMPESYSKMTIRKKGEVDFWNYDNAWQFLNPVAFTSSKLTIEKLEQGAKYVQS